MSRDWIPMALRARMVRCVLTVLAIWTSRGVNPFDSTPSVTNARSGTTLTTAEPLTWIVRLVLQAAWGVAVGWFVGVTGAAARAGSPKAINTKASMQNNAALSRTGMYFMETS